MEWLKSQLASWKVRVALAGGALVVATAYGTCSFDPTLVTTNDSISGTTATEIVEVSTTTDGNTNTTTDNTTTGNTTTETTGRS